MSSIDDVFVARRRLEHILKNDDKNQIEIE